MEMKDRECSEWKILKSISERRDLSPTQDLDYPKKSEESEVTLWSLSQASTLSTISHFYWSPVSSFEKI